MPAYLSDVYSSSIAENFSIVTSLEQKDSLPTSRVSAMMAGIMNDPVFGVAAASFYTELHLTTASLNFSNPADYVADSVVLYLAYENNYGPVTMPVSLAVYEIDSAMKSEEVYYHFSTKPVKPVSLGGVVYIPNLTDSPIVGGIKRAPLLRIKLSKSLGQKIIQQGSFASNEEWLQFFKGICVTPTSHLMAGNDGALIANKYNDQPLKPPAGKGFITSFNLLNSDSRMVLYYHQISTGITAMYEFNIPAKANRFNHFEIDYTGTPVQDKMDQSPLMDTLSTYVQSMCGVYTRIWLRDLSDRFPAGYLINKAELILPVNNSLTGAYGLPVKLMLVSVDSVGRESFLPDYNEGSSFFDGTYHADQGAYVFNITRYIHAKVNKKQTDDRLALYISGMAVQASRVVLNNEKHPTFPMKLRVYYSTVNQ